MQASRQAGKPAKQAGKKAGRLEGSTQESRQAGRQAGRQASQQAGRQQGTPPVSELLPSCPKPIAPSAHRIDRGGEGINACHPILSSLKRTL